MIDKIAKKISNNSDYSYEVCIYLLRTNIHLFFSLMLIMLIAYLLNIVIWAGLIIAIYMGLRMFSGGAHSKSKIICTTISLLMPVGGGLFINNIKIPEINILIISFIVTVLSFAILIKYAPADTLEKPIISLDFKRQLRRNSIIFITILEIIIIILYFMNYNYFEKISLSIIIGIVCQIFSIIPLGYLLLSYLDSVFIKAGGKLCNNQSISHF